jgi:hypothetical protein
MMFDHEHQHPPSVGVPGVDRFTLFMAKLCVGLSMIAVVALLVHSGTRVLW